MPTHNTPPPHADQTDQTAEPARRAPCFDERGIALQTIIIMVVLLAIAGTVAAVLFNRASTETARLEGQTTNIEVLGITNEILCKNANGQWVTEALSNSTTPYKLADVQTARKDTSFATGSAWCKPN